MLPFNPARFGNPACMASGGVTFVDPNSYAVQLWLDPSDLSTMFQLSGGTTAVSADADPVGYFNNKGTGSITCIQATAGNRPLYKTSGGLRWLLSDGVNDTLAASGNISEFTTVSTYDVMIAFRAVAITFNNVNVYQNDALYSDTGQLFGAHLKFGTPSVSGYNWDGNADSATDTIAIGTDYVARVTHSGGNLSITLNNGTPVTVASGNTSAGGGTFTLFTALGNFFSNARLYGMVARKTTFSSTEAGNLWTYLGAKAGLTL